MPPGCTRPRRPGRIRCVVMAHGSAECAARGCGPSPSGSPDAGMAALVFDYRHFGDSTGEPRQLLDISLQQDDYRAAIAFARGLDGVDPDRVAMWGTSFSGGHVAGGSRRRTTGSRPPCRRARTSTACGLCRVAGPRNNLRMTAAGLRDEAASPARPCRPSACRSSAPPGHACRDEQPGRGAGLPRALRPGHGVRATR